MDSGHFKELLCTCMAHFSNFQSNIIPNIKMHILHHHKNVMSGTKNEATNNVTL